MKLHIIPILATLAFASSSSAVSFDTAAFGASLNGWRKDRTAIYSFTDAQYRTYTPTISISPSGGMFLSTQVEMLAAAGKGATCQIGLTFSPTGTLEGAQIKGSIGKTALDTGLVRRPDAPVPTASLDGQAAVTPPRPFHATDEMIAELFTRFDTEMKKVTEAKDTRRSDLFSRLAGNNVKSADLSAGLRHNVNRLLQQVKH